MNSQTVSNGIAVTLVAGMFLTVSVLFYFWFFEKPFLTYKNIPFPPQMIQVYPGEIIPFHEERCNSDDKPRNYDSTHSLLNIDTHEPLLLPDVKIMIQPGCTTAVSLLNRVPPETPPGKYVVFGTAEVHGTIRDFYIEWRTQEFEVVAKPVQRPLVVMPAPKNKQLHQ